MSALIGSQRAANHVLAVVLSILTPALAVSGAQAQTASSALSAHVPEVTQQAVDGYWTADRLKSAKPMDLAPKVGANGLPIVNDAGPVSGPSVKSKGAAPSVELGPLSMKTLIAPQAQDLQLQNLASPGPEPEATSSYGADFTTARVSPDSTTVSYPYRAAGKLYFSDPRTGGNFVCSASVLRPRIIVTAGHCVTKPSTTAANRYFYSNFLFVPAYNNGAAPYYTWTPSVEWISNAWYFSDGSVPNAQDVGMLVANDRTIGNARYKLGNITGWYGYWTNQLGNNNVTMLGYPCNLDNCQKEEMNNAQTFAYGGNNTYTYGSAMRGGSSGGPWVQDFGIAPVSNPAVALGGNYIVGVTSYGPIATDPKYQGASNLDSRFLSLLSAACGPATSGNC